MSIVTQVQVFVVLRQLERRPKQSAFSRIYRPFALRPRADLRASNDRIRLPAAAAGHSSPARSV